jgi:hypothetical protein
MPRKSSDRTRPSEMVMDEFAEELIPWDLDEHLNGCLAGYQSDPNYGTSVYFALEALWGIARDVGIRAGAGMLDPVQLDKDWILAPKTHLPVPWIWVRALSVAWEKYKSEGGPLGQSFGLEGGQGKSPTITKLMQMLDERAIARWMWSRVHKLRATGQEIRIEDIVQEAAEKFDRSDVTIRRAWQRFGRLERLRTEE